MTLEWYFLNSLGMALGTDPPQFYFREAPYAVHTVVRKLNAPLDGTARIMYKIEGRGKFILVNGTIPTVSLFFQRRGDDWSGQGPYASYRWYHAGGTGTLTVGEHRIEVPLKPEYWTNVWGQHDAVRFRAAKLDAEHIGFCFGDPGAGATCHGLYGSALFMIYKYAVR